MDLRKIQDSANKNKGPLTRVEDIIMMMAIMIMIIIRWLCRYLEKLFDLPVEVECRPSKLIHGGIVHDKPGDVSSGGGIFLTFRQDLLRRPISSPQFVNESFSFLIQKESSTPSQSFCRQEFRFPRWILGINESRRMNLNQNDIKWFTVRSGRVKCPNSRHFLRLSKITFYSEIQNNFLLRDKKEKKHPPHFLTEGK